MRKRRPELKKCRIRGCKASTDWWMPFCRTHWRKVSVVQQDEIKEAWRRRDTLAASKLIREAEKIIQGEEIEKAKEAENRDDSCETEEKEGLARTLF